MALRDAISTFQFGYRVRPNPLGRETTYNSTVTSRALAFANTAAIKNNPILRFTYWMTFPLVLAAKSAKLTPNFVTAASLLTGIFACVSLGFQNVGLFFMFWTTSYLLDFVDGTLARMTSKLSSFPLDIDHFSDLIKLSLMFIGFGLYYSETVVWLLSSLAMFGFLFWDSINSGARVVEMRSFAKPLGQTPNFSEPRACRPVIRSASLISRTRKILRKHPFLKTCETLFLSIHAHTFLVFFIVPLSAELAIVSFSYIILLVFLNSAKAIFSFGEGPENKGHESPTALGPAQDRQPSEVEGQYGRKKLE